MGSFRYERIPAVPNTNNNVFEFDSSVDRAVARKYGYELGSVEVRERESESNDRYRVFDVYARENRSSPENDPMPLRLRGELYALRNSEIWRKQQTGTAGYEQSFPPTKESIRKRESEFHLR